MNAFSLNFNFFVLNYFIPMDMLHYILINTINVYDIFIY